MAPEMLGLRLRQGGNADKAGFVGDQIERPGDYLELGPVPRPVPGPGQVLIKVRRAAVNPSDMAFIQGFYGQKRVQGRPAGFEGVGRVVEAGPGLMGRYLRGRDVGFYVTPDGSGAWAEYALTQAASALPLKKGVADRDAAGLIVNPVTAAAMMELVKPGDAFVFSAAASQLGKLIASLARDQGKKMIALVRRPEPVAALKSLGATHVLDESHPDFADQLATTFAKETPVIFLDAVAGSASARVHQTMGNNARWVIYGKLDVSPAEILDPSDMIFRNKTVEGYWTTDWARKTSFLRKLRVFGEVQNRFRDGRWTTDLSAELPLQQVIERLPQALAQPDGKVQIIMPEG
ncbi:zinc-binding dehydrogenase [Shimia sediminis]|uniref:zinc-binding dehydrogenase n=1 Tax=Shimia sediminis TaxID=2497945 RepID=UPI000F8E0D43|nr:zinc-binding dehydrogenase [Shimia sediminis]